MHLCVCPTQRVVKAQESGRLWGLRDGLSHSAVALGRPFGSSMINQVAA